MSLETNQVRRQLMKTAGWITITVGLYLVYQGSKFDDAIDIEIIDVEAVED